MQSRAFAMHAYITTVKFSKWPTLLLQKPLLELSNLFSIVQKEKGKKLVGTPLPSNLFNVLKLEARIKQLLQLVGCIGILRLTVRVQGKANTLFCSQLLDRKHRSNQEKHLYEDAVRSRYPGIYYRDCKKLPCHVEMTKQDFQFIILLSFQLKSANYSIMPLKIVSISLTYVDCPIFSFFNKERKGGEISPNKEKKQSK